MKNYALTHEPLTLGGYRWTIDSLREDGEHWLGIVYLNDRERVTEWFENADGDLQSLGNRAFTIRKRAVDQVLEGQDPDPIQINTPARTLDTDFIISTTRAAMVKYTLALSTTNSLLGGSTTNASASLLIDGNAVAEVKHALASTLTLGLSLNHVDRKILSATVPAGATVNIQTNTLGTATVTLVDAQETLL